MASKLHSWTEKLIQSLKKDASYQLDRDISVSDLLDLLTLRGMSAIRGWLLRPRLAKGSDLLFVGKRVTIKHKNKLSTGRSVTLDDYVTIDALSRNGVIIGNNVTIARFATIQCTGVIQELGVGLQIGDNSAVGAYSFLGAQGGITIGANVIMGPMVSMHSENHTYADLSRPIRLQPTTRRGICIEDNCWVGAKVTILDGVNIGSNCVVAAGTVVTKDIPPNSLAAGVPAKVIKHLE
jgi:acetyltransferase-like isoleucine patch superfamily enzyme